MSDPTSTASPEKGRATGRVLLSIGVIQVLIILVGMGRAKVLSVLLGPAGFGIVSTIDQVVMSMVHLAGLSLPFTSLKFLSRSHSESHRRFQASYASFLRGMALLSVVALAVVSGLLIWTPGVFGADLVPYRGVLSIAVLSIPALILNVFLVHTLAAAQESTTSALVTLCVAFSLAVAACVGVWLGDIRALYIATVGVGVFTTLVTLVFVQRRLGLRVSGAEAGIVQELRRSPEVVSFSLMLYVAMAAYSLCMLVIRYLVFSRVGEVEAGLLQALFSIALALGAVLGPMNTLFLTPLVNRALPAPEKLAAAHAFQQNMAVLLAAVALPAILFPRLALTILFAPSFQPAAATLYLFVLWQVVYQLVNVYQQLLIGLDDVWFYTASTTLGFTLAAGLGAALIPTLGLSGAALALVIGVAFNGAATAVRLQTKFGAGIPAGVWRLVLYAGGSVLLTGWLFGPENEWSVEGVALRVVFALGFAALTWRVLAEDQRLFFLGLVGRFVPGKNRKDG